MKLYDQALHDIWNGVLADPGVPAHSIIMEAMERARSLGVGGTGKRQKYGAAFAKLEKCAEGRERCPQNDQIPSAAFSALARAGRIRVMVFRKNYRVVEILIGPQAGKRTADAPDRRIGETPYMVIDAKSPPSRKDIPKHQRQEPWKPGTARHV